MNSTRRRFCLALAVYTAGDSLVFAIILAVPIEVCVQYKNNSFADFA